MPFQKANNNIQALSMQKAHIAILVTLSIVLLCLESTTAQTTDPYLQLLKENAKKGSPTEQYILGRKYILGNGTVKDPANGLQWLKKASRDNYTPATLYLGKIFEQGTGVEKDYIKAVQWYKKAAEQGSDSASMKIAALEDKDPAQEFVLYDISLQKANKLCIRYALQENGAVLLPRKDSDLCDKFNTNKLMPGSDKAQACYTSKNKLAHIEYRFPPSRPENTLQDIHSRLSERYGEPQASRNGSQYVWKSKGVKIDFRYDARFRTAFLRYTLPQRQKQFVKLLKQKESNSSSQQDNH
ncbi:MAG: tetratricopeptide repeat protein [Thermodesulfobacteriota bacterium]